MSETVTTNGMSRREELLAVATKLFAARGYHGTRSKATSVPTS